MIGRTIKEIIEFGNEYNQKTQEYQTKSQNIHTQVETGMLGSVKASDDLKEISNVINTSFEEKQNKLIDQLEKDIDDEKLKIANSKESITQDVLAELTVLATLKLSTHDIEQYGNEYKNNPLALRRLHEIAKEQDITTFINVDNDSKGEVLERLAQYAKVVLKSYRSLKTNFHGHESNSVVWIVNGNNEGLQTLLSKYTSL